MTACCPLCDGGHLYPSRDCPLDPSNQITRLRAEVARLKASAAMTHRCAFRHEPIGLPGDVVCPLCTVLDRLEERTRERDEAAFEYERMHRERDEALAEAGNWRTLHSGVLKERDKRLADRTGERDEARDAYSTYARMYEQRTRERDEALTRGNAMFNAQAADTCRHNAHTYQPCAVEHEELTDAKTQWVKFLARVKP